MLERGLFPCLRELVARRLMIMTVGEHGVNHLDFDVKSELPFADLILVAPEQQRC